MFVSFSNISKHFESLLMPELPSLADSRRQASRTTEVYIYSLEESSFTKALISDGETQSFPVRGKKCKHAVFTVYNVGSESALMSFLKHC
jgi:hypothetical protein